MLSGGGRGEDPEDVFADQLLADGLENRFLFAAGRIDDVDFDQVCRRLLLRLFAVGRRDLSGKTGVVFGKFLQIEVKKTGGGKNLVDGKIPFAAEEFRYPGFLPLQRVGDLSLRDVVFLHVFF